MLEKWSTRIDAFEVGQDINDDIARYMLAEEMTSKKTTEFASLKGRSGYHSEYNFFDIDQPWCNVLKQHIILNCRKYLEDLGHEVFSNSVEKLFGWTMIIRQGDHSTLHCHPDADVSGVYYVRVPYLDDREGNICFVDPRPSARSHRYYNTPAMCVKPEQGKAYIFPSWLDHYVTPFYDKGTRISVAFNYTLN